MNAGDSTNLLPSSLAVRLDEAVDRFEVEWRDGAPPSVAEYLTSNDEITNELMFELVKVDLEQRWRRADVGSSPGVAAAEPASGTRFLEEYLIEFPDLTSQPESLLELVGEEYRARHRWGDRPSHLEYTTRYSSLNADRLLRTFRTIDDELAIDSAPSVPIADIEHSGTVISTRGGDALDSSTVIEEGPTAEDPADVKSGGDTRILEIPFDDDASPEIDATTDFLVNTYPFSELPKRIVEEIARRIQEREFAAGTTIIRQGEDARDLLVLTEGVAEVTSVDDGAHSRVITRVGSHTVLGEIALMTREPRSANVTAISNVRALALDVDDFHYVADMFPTLNVIFSELVAERVGTVGLDVLCGKTLDHYHIEQRLGRGSMGVVYEAFDLRSGDRVALKMMSHALIYDHQAVSRFHRETEIVESLSHPNIIRSYGKFTAMSTFFIVMEFCDGLPLSHVLESSNGLPEDQVRRLLGQLAAALQYTHSLKIVHRDLKPGNVVLRWDGQLKLMDYGLARTVQSAELTMTGQIIGTPRYMPPEQLAGSPVGFEADIFAMGCIAYELVTGEPRLEAGDLVSLMRQQLEWELPSAIELDCEISDELYALIATCLDQDPKRRTVDLEAIAAWAGPFDMTPFFNVIDMQDDSTSEAPTIVHPFEPHVDGED